MNDLSFIECMLATIFLLIVIYIGFRLASLAVFNSFKQTFKKEDQDGEEKQERQSPISKRTIDESDEKVSTTTRRRNWSAPG